MPNTLNAKEALARKMLLQMEANTVFMMNSHRDYEKDMVRWVTDTKAEVEIRLPNNFEVNNTWDITSADKTVEERYITLIADQIRNVSMDLSTFESTFEIDQQFEERTITPAATNLALDVDNRLAEELFFNSYHHIGTAGATVASWTSVSQMAAYMNDLAFPEGGMRVGVLSEETYGVLGGDPNLQNSNATDITKDITRRWKIGNLANINLFHNHAIVKHTAGLGDTAAAPTAGSVAAGAIKATVSSGSILTVKGLGTSDTRVFVKGDKITIPNRQFLHPRTLKPTGRPFQVTVTDTTVDSDSSGDAVVNITPAIITTGKYPNVDAALAVDDNLVLASANSGTGSTTLIPYTANVFYHKTGLLFAAPPLKKLFNDDGFINKDSISLRVSANGNINTSQRITRVDNLHGSVIDGTRVAILLG